MKKSIFTIIFALVTIPVIFIIAITLTHLNSKAFQVVIEPIPLKPTVFVEPTPNPTIFVRETPQPTKDLTTISPILPTTSPVSNMSNIISVSPTPTSTTNSAPTVTTDSLPPATLGSSYYTTIKASDNNLSDTLEMSISGLPFGLVQGPCSTPLSGGEIICTITGVPFDSGIYTIQLKVSDGHISKVSKNITLMIKSN